MYGSHPLWVQAESVWELVNLIFSVLFEVQAGGRFPTPTLSGSVLITMRDCNPSDLRAKYTRFRILVIGRANAGKTTLLQRVCNTTEDPCIYDKNNKNLVSFHISEDGLCF